MMQSSAKARDLLRSGLAHHRAGDLKSAQTCYSEIIRREPRNADALHLSGVVARQQDDLEASKRLIRKAIAINEFVATYHHNLGRTHALQGNLTLAIASYRRALSLHAEDVDSMQALARLLGETGEVSQAIALYKTVLDLSPGRSEVYYSLGLLLKVCGDMESALEFYKRAAELFPETSDSHFNLAKTLYEAGRPAESLLCYQRVLALNPDDAETHNCVARILHERGDLGLARQSYLRALHLCPDFPEALSNLGALQMDAGEFKTAQALLRRAIAVKPDLMNAYCNLGSLLTKQGDALGAVEAFRKVLMKNPRDVTTLSNLGCTLDALGDSDGAASCFRMALEVEPTSSLARFNLSSHILLAGDFAEGWREYEQRWEVRQFAGKREPFAQPQWQGEPILGSRIYVYAEQGLGDTLHFVRYVPKLVELGAEVVLEVQPLLYSLLRDMGPAVRVVPKRERPQDVDWHCPLLSLAGVFRTDLGNMPAAVPYLHAEPGKKETWSRRLATVGLRVGLVWTGNPEHTRDRLRSIPIAHFGRLTEVKGSTFYSLQKGLTAKQWDDVAAATRDLTDLGLELEDFTDTAAIVANLDLVITVDTSVAHLAGAMGKPVWILLPHAPDWRWLKDRTDSPWYPTARLFRQTVAGRWGDVLDRVAADLQQLAAAAYADRGGCMAADPDASTMLT